MKKNRSNVFTVGLCNSFRDDKTIRTAFFELDKEHKDFYEKVISNFDKFQLDYVIHRTGSGGFHFISPTIITKTVWKQFMENLSGINPKCPMTTLRMKPNKYPNEALYWYKTRIQKFPINKERNSLEMANYLNKIFQCDFNGTIEHELIIVHYPLPFVEVQP